MVVRAACDCRPRQPCVTLPPFLNLVQERVDRVYQKPEEWTAMSINSTAGSGFFSSDRTILEYAK